MSKFPLKRLRQIAAFVERAAEEVRPYSTGNRDDKGPGWSDLDEASRSLAEAGIYLTGWLAYRETHGEDPSPPNPL